MATERVTVKTDVNVRKPAPDPRAALPRPEIRSPLFNDGLEMVRDGNC